MGWKLWSGNHCLRQNRIEPVGSKANISVWRKAVDSEKNKIGNKLSLNVSELPQVEGVSPVVFAPEKTEITILRRLP